eukprot:5111984-Amphidinium_carterae.3
MKHSGARAPMEKIPRISRVIMSVQGEERCIAHGEVEPLETCFGVKTPTTNLMLNRSRLGWNARYERWRTSEGNKSSTVPRSLWATPYGRADSATERRTEVYAHAMYYDSTREIDTDSPPQGPQV